MITEPALATPRLTMRPLCALDLDAVAAMLADPAVMRYYSAGARDRAYAEQWIEWSERGWREHGTGFFAVHRKNDGEFLGQCGPLPMTIDERFDYEVGYMFAAEHWGRGYATEAARRARDWAFETHGPDRVVSFINPANTPSIKVAQRNGMRLFKKRFVEKWGIDVLIYGILRAEWEAEQAQS